MTNAEEKAEAYLAANAGGGFKMPVTWEVKTAYIAGYQDAERYRLILQAAIRNATPQVPAAHDD